MARYSAIWNRAVRLICFPSVAKSPSEIGCLGIQVLRSSVEIAETLLHKELPKVRQRLCRWPTAGTCLPTFVKR